MNGAWLQRRARTASRLCLLDRPSAGPDDPRTVDIGKPVRDFWGRRTRFQKIGLVAGLVFIGLGISTYVGDPFGLGAVVTLSTACLSRRRSATNSA